MGSVNTAECLDVDKIRRSVPILGSIVQSDTEKSTERNVRLIKKLS